MGSDLLGDGQQLLKNGLSLLAARHGDMIDVLQYGSEIAAGIEQTADNGEEYQQHQQHGDLQTAFQYGAVIAAFGDQHGQGVGVGISAGDRERLREAHEGESRPGKGGKPTAQLILRQQLVRHKAEAVGREGQKASSDVQPRGGIRQDAGKTADAGGLGVMRRKVGLIDGKAAKTVHRTIRADHGDGQKDRLLCGAGQGDKLRGAAAALYGSRRRLQMLRKAGKVREGKLLRPLPVGHHLMPPSDVRHAAVEQKGAGGMLGVAALDIDAAI